MRTVQLDKNAGGRKLKDACNKEGIVRCILLPHDVRERSDAEVLEFGIENGYLTLTFDRQFYIETAHILVGQNPGLLLMRVDDESDWRINTKTAPKILRDFKNSFPEWYSVPWRNSVIELTPTLVFVYHTLSYPLQRIVMLKRTENGWQEALKCILESNANL